jgi:hypothetical protein
LLAQGSAGSTQRREAEQTLGLTQEVPVHLHRASTGSQVSPSSQVTLSQGLPPWPQTLATPAPPQVSAPEQVPQLTVRDASQLSKAVTLSQSLPRRVQKALSVSAVQPQRLAWPPPPQVAGASQPPHSSVPPQPSPTLPHCAPAAWQVVLTQVPESGTAVTGGLPHEARASARALRSTGVVT